MGELNWAGNYEYRAARIATPGSLDELREAIGSATKVRIEQCFFTTGCQTADQQASRDHAVVVAYVVEISIGTDGERRSSVADESRPGTGR